MKRFFCVFILLFFVLGLVSANLPVIAAEKEKPEAEKKAVPQRKAAGGLYLSGSVTSVNHDAKLMTVKGWRGNVTLDISNPTLKGYKELREISPGDKVKVRYTSFGIEITKVAKAKK